LSAIETVALSSAGKITNLLGIEGKSIKTFWFPTNRQIS